MVGFTHRSMRTYRQIAYIACACLSMCESEIFCENVKFCIEMMEEYIDLVLTKFENDKNKSY